MSKREKLDKILDESTDIAIKVNRMLSETFREELGKRIDKKGAGTMGALQTVLNAMVTGQTQFINNTVRSLREMKDTYVDAAALMVYDNAIAHIEQDIKEWEKEDSENYFATRQLVNSKSTTLAEMEAEV